jgi:hypothetical protein
MLAVLLMWVCQSVGPKEEMLAVGLLQLVELLLELVLGPAHPQAGHPHSQR